MKNQPGAGRDSNGEITLLSLRAEGYSAALAAEIYSACRQAMDEEKERQSCIEDAAADRREAAEITERQAAE